MTKQGNEVEKLKRDSRFIELIDHFLPNKSLHPQYHTIKLYLTLEKGRNEY